MPLLDAGLIFFSVKKSASSVSRSGPKSKLRMRFDQFLERDFRFFAQIFWILRVAAAPAGQPLGTEQAGIGGMGFCSCAMGERERGG